MNQKIETVLKAILIIAGLLVGSETLTLFDAERVNLVSGAISVLAAVVLDGWSTYRLQKQGIVSTSPAANVAAPGSPAKLAKEEKST